MNTCLNRGASGGLAGAQRRKKNQPTANSTTRLAHRNSDTPVPPDEQIRSKIIRATNSQTPINEVSLRATDPIHFDIEEKFRLYNLFYERRKGEYRELKKPADQIISIQTLAKSSDRAATATAEQRIRDSVASPKERLRSCFQRTAQSRHVRDLHPDAAAS